MFLTKNDIINKLTMYDIPKATRALSNATNIEKQRDLMGHFIDPAIVQQLDDNTVGFLFRKTKDAVETKIRLLIRDNTGQIAVAEGKEVKLLCDFTGHNKGTIGKIKKCIRFEEDTFGQGWYAYDVEISETKPILRLYRHEFEPV